MRHSSTLPGGLFSLGFLRKRPGGRHRADGQGEIGADDAPELDEGARAILEAICRAARADGEVDEAERAEIMTAAEALTGASIPPELVDAMIEHAVETAGAVHVGTLVSDAPEMLHEAMMRGVLFVISARGHVVPEEWDFVTDLALEMQMTGERLREMVAEIAELRAA